MHPNSSGEDRLRNVRLRSAVRRQCERIGHSECFAGSKRLVLLLRHLVDETLEGHGGDLVETVIGNAVYRRDPPYDPRIDSTVRVEVRRLRQKLSAYYAGEGRADAIRIDVPVGSYVPLFSELSRGRTGRAPGAEAASPDVGDGFEPGDGTLVAIMPFRSLNRGARGENLAAGLTAEVAFVLGQEQGVTVISGDATWRSREEIAQRLGIDLFVNGLVRSSRTMVRVTVEVAYPNGILAWADRLDAPRMDSLRLQEIIAATLVSHARIDNSLARSWEVRPKATALERNARVNRARLLLSRQSPESIREALARFTQVSETAPGYARGHSGVADCLTDLYRLELIGADAAEASVVEAARRALGCDGRSIEALTALATAEAWLERRPPVAEARYGEAIALGGCVRSFRGEALLMSALGRDDEASRALARARELEPISPLLDVSEAISRFCARRFEAIEALRRDRARAAVGTVPFEVTYFAALGLMIDGSRDEGLALLPEIERAAADYPGYVHAAEEIRALAGLPDTRPPEARVDRAGTHYGRAALMMALDDEDGALAALAAAVAEREASTFWIRVDPRFDRLRRREDFRALSDGAWRA